MLELRILKISDTIIKQIEEYFIKSNVEYHIEKQIDDIILTMYPQKIEQINFIIDILYSNEIESRMDGVVYLPSDFRLVKSSLWIFETSRENKEDINRILNEVDQILLNIQMDTLKALGISQHIKKGMIPPPDCNYGIIVDSSLQSSIKNVLQSLKLEYKILDKYGHVIEGKNEKITR